ncbi:MAG: hypothetical protein ACKOHK_03975 [Planctomycetia bacterium]
MNRRAAEFETVTIGGAESDLVRGSSRLVSKAFGSFRMAVLTAMRVTMQGGGGGRHRFLSRGHTVILP